MKIIFLLIFIPILIFFEVSSTWCGQGLFVRQYIISNNTIDYFNGSLMVITEDGDEYLTGSRVFDGLNEISINIIDGYTIYKNELYIKLKDNLGKRHYKKISNQGMSNEEKPTILFERLDWVDLTSFKCFGGRWFVVKTGVVFMFFAIFFYMSRNKKLNLQKNNR